MHFLNEMFIQLKSWAFLGLLHLAQIPFLLLPCRSLFPSWPRNPVACDDFCESFDDNGQWQPMTSYLHHLWHRTNGPRLLCGIPTKPAKEIFLRKLDSWKQHRKCQKDYNHQYYKCEWFCNLADFPEGMILKGVVSKGAKKGWKSKRRSRAWIFI